MNNKGAKARGDGGTGVRSLRYGLNDSLLTNSVDGIAGASRWGVWSGERCGDKLSPPLFFGWGALTALDLWEGVRVPWGFTPGYLVMGFQPVGKKASDVSDGLDGLGGSRWQRKRVKFEF